MTYKRVFLIILDGMGIGGAPDAADFGDEGSDTFAHVCKVAPRPYRALAQLGLANLYDDLINGISPTAEPAAVYGRLTEVSKGKDTTTGHWELMGLVRSKPSPTFPDGFPRDFLDVLSNHTGRSFIGNLAASGTEIIKQLGREHIATGHPVVYTSADSVFQIAAHVDVVNIEELYAICESARDLLTGDLAVDRVIARPFTGTPEQGFIRTKDRKDFSLPPPGDTALVHIAQAGLDVLAIGKISDIFAGQGVTRRISAHGNSEIMETVGNLQHDDTWRGLVFANLIDFDMLFGHRNNPEGFADALLEFDTWLSGFMLKLSQEELVVITADHGNDPTTESTDHSREQVPVLLTSNTIAQAGGRRVYPKPGLFHVGISVLGALGICSDMAGSDLLAVEV